MSTATKLNGIINSKTAIKTAIENKHVTVGNAKLSEYAGKIDKIQLASDKWYPYWKGENISETCQDGEIRLKIRDDFQTAFTITLSNTAYYYNVYIQGVLYNTYKSGTKCTITPIIGGGNSNIYTSYTTYDVTIIPVNGIIQTWSALIAPPDMYKAQGILWLVFNVANINTNGGSIYGSTGCVHLECLETKQVAVLNYAMCSGMVSLRKLKGNFIEQNPINTNSTNELFNGCILTDIEGFTVPKNGINYTNTFSGIRYAINADGVYPNCLTMNGSFTRCIGMKGLDVTGPNFTSFNNSYCQSAKYLFIRQSNFKSITTPSTLIYALFWSNMTEQAWLDFADTIETLGDVAHTMDLRYSSGVTAAVVARLTAKKWNVLKS